jgi:hypothetical protein
MRLRLCEFLAPFYPDEQEAIRFRIFAPRGYPRYHEKNLSKPFGDIFPREYTVARCALAGDRNLQEQIKNENRLCGVYFVVNSGTGESKRLVLGVYARRSKKDETPEWTQYVEDQDIGRFNAFFIEGDSKSIDEQMMELERCPISPSIVVITRKSVHAYWLCAPSITIIEWIEIQARLIAYFGSDASIKNPPRVMRLPGLDHLSYDATNQTMARKRVEVARFNPEQRFTAEEMHAVFPSVEAESAKWQPPAGGSGDYRTWEEFGNELRRRMAAHPTAHRQGEKTVLRGVCHDGKGDSALFFNTITGKYHCAKGCRKEDIFRAFGLPERPTGAAGSKFKGRIVHQHARSIQITNKPWTDNPAVVDFANRLRVAQGVEADASTITEDNTLIDDAVIINDGGPVNLPLGICSDCGVKSLMVGEWCFECSELRKFLNDGPNALACGCVGANRWRYRDGGSIWYCGNCERDRAPVDAVWSFQNGGSYERNNGRKYWRFDQVVEL